MLRVLIVAMLTSIFSAQAASIHGEDKIRQPAVAGSFYPTDPVELGKMIDGFLAKANPPAIKNLVAIVSPHAGYIYSGGVAANSYALLRGRRVERVVVIAPSHYEAFDFISVYDGIAYATPFGQIPVDREFAGKLAALSPHIKLSDRAHTVVVGNGEHALEVQLPFLQRVLGQFKLVPIIMGAQDYDLCRALGASLAKLIAGPETLIVASSDLSHYHPYATAVTIDHKTLKAIEEWDYLNMARNFERRVWEACGGGPIVAAMIAAERLGANQAKVLKYANSGDVIGDHSRVVGYGAVAFYKSPQASQAGESFTLTAKEKERLLEIAQKSVEAAVREGKLYECSAGGMEALMQERGAFVTLTKNGELRGCVGYVGAMKPLCHAVRDVGAYAALRDQRFIPVTVRELDQLEYEISVLSPLRHVMDIKQIRPGRDGLLIRNKDGEGLLLPQVAAEQHWDRTTFLEQTCRKAGLPRNAWQNADTDIFRFTALVFGGHKPLESLIPEAPRLPKPAGWPVQLAPDSQQPAAQPF